MVEKGKSTSPRTRRVAIRYFFVKDHMENGKVEIAYLSTELMVAVFLPSLYRENYSEDSELKY